ncbi:DUF6609 family protein [Heyndrickxia coagulans]|uniref:DUF6609 family protein n=1 Tax=Heyndrickxia coagulans TaxID=1398 RepID=UPI000A48ADFD
MIWLAAFLSFGIHFFPLDTVYGKIMLPLAVLCLANVIAGMLLPNVPFTIFVYADFAAMGIFASSYCIPKTTTHFLYMVPDVRFSASSYRVPITRLP